MKKVWCIILSIVTVMSLSACGKEESALVKQYGQEMVKYYGEEKVKEMDIKCSDEAQLQVANNLVETAKSNLSYCGSKNNVDTDSCGALKKYFYSNNDLVMGMGETYSRWDIEEKDGTWVVIAIDEMA